MCNIDHHLVCARLRLQLGGHRRRVLVARRKKFYAEKLGVSHYKKSDKEGRLVRDEFQKQAVERAMEAWPEEEGVEEKWLAL